MVRLKLLFRGLKTNKYSNALVFFTVLLTVLVLIANFSFKDSVENIRISQLRDTTMNTQILITSSDETSDYLFNLAKLESILKANKNVASYVTRYSFYAQTTLQTKEVYFYSLDLEAQKSTYEIELIEGIVDFAEQNGVIVSQKFSQENKLAIDESFVIQTESGETEVIVKGIADSNGFFLGADNIIISKLQFADNLFRLNGKINRIDVTLKKMDKIDNTVSELNKALKGTTLLAEPKFNSDFYDSYVSTIVLALNLFVIFMLFISVYIILSVFKSSVYENMQEMVTLRSIGFSIRNYRFLVIGQSLAVTILASGAAFILSIPFIKLLLALFLSETGEVSVNYTMTIASIVFVNLISLVSVWIATRNVVNTRMIDILKNNIIQEKSNHKKRKFVLGLAFIIFAILSFIILPNVLEVYGYIISISCALVGTIFIQKELVYLFALFIKRIFRKKSGALGLFSKQLHFHCGSYTQSVSIIVLVLTIATLTVSISGVIKESLKSVYKGADIYIQNYSADCTDLVYTIKSNREVDSYIVEQRAYSNINGSDVIVAGIPVDQYITKDYERVLGGTRQEIFSKLNEENSIIVTSTFAKNNNKVIGDPIKVEGLELEIVGEVSSFEEMGNVLFVSENTFSKLYTNPQFELLLLTTINEDVESVASDLQRTVNDMGLENCFISTVEDMYKENDERNQLIINVIYGLCAISLLISAISLVNNLIINFSTRKRDFLIYQTIGVTKNQMKITVLYEALSMGMYSGAVGVLAGILILPMVLQVLSYYVGSVEYTIIPFSLFMLIIISCVLVIIAAMTTISRYIVRYDLLSEVKKIQ